MNLQPQPLNNLSHATPASASATLPALADLETVAELFLHAKAGSCKKSSVRDCRYKLETLVARHGKQPIAQVESQHIQKVVHNRRWHPNTRHDVLGDIKELFGWAQANGYLTSDQPTAADSIVVLGHTSPLQFLCSAELKELFSSKPKVGVLLETALHAFGGLEVAALAKLRGEHVRRKQGIAISRALLGKARLAPIPRVLDAWLRPFYGCSGRLIRNADFRREFQQWAREHNIHNLSVLLRNSFCVYRLAETGNPGRTATEVGLDPGPFQKRFGPIAASVTDSGEYFSLTPRKVGLRNWPRMVKEYLAEASGRRRAKPSRSAAGRLTD